ncbi:MAG: hypothetical protein IT480_07625 [Gammaproteobacteria bacterium]|nr:hypothetical protein [Gammaproteobacteria bacterium]
MRPLAVLLGIVMGSSIAVAVSLGMTAVVFLLLPEYHAQIDPERGPLLRGLVWSWSLAALAAAAFIGELRARRWRRAPQALLLALVLLLAWIYWPR